MLRPCAEVGYSNVHASHLLAATRLAQMSELGQKAKLPDFFA